MLLMVLVVFWLWVLLLLLLLLQILLLALSLAPLFIRFCFFFIPPPLVNTTTAMHGNDYLVHPLSRTATVCVRGGQDLLPEIQCNGLPTHGARRSSHGHEGLELSGLSRIAGVH